MPLCSHIVLLESGYKLDGTQVGDRGHHDKPHNVACVHYRRHCLRGCLRCVRCACFLHAGLDKPAAAPDRMAPVNRFGNENGQATIKQGNSTFQFGNQQSFGQRYNTDNIFNPYARDGR